MNRKILLLLLAVGAILFAANETLISLAAPPSNPRIRIETDPETFPDGLRGVPFDFGVTVIQDGGRKKEVHLSLLVECPAGGVALLSGDAQGNACDGPVETTGKDLNSGPVRWLFTVVYQGSTGTYMWTIEAHGDDDDDCGPGFWKNHEELWDSGADDVTTTYETTHTFNAAFGVTPSDSGLDDGVTLLGALEVAGGDRMALNRHAAAALLNADSADYPLSVSEVIALYKDAVGAVGGPETVSSAHQILATNNAQADCEFDD